MSRKRDLELIGAWFIRSTDVESYPKAIRKAINKAEYDMTDSLEEKQYKLYNKGKCCGTKAWKADKDINL